MKKRIVFDIYSDENYEDLENSLQEIVSDYLTSKQIKATCQVRENRYITIPPHRKKEVLTKILQDDVYFLEKSRHKVNIYTSIGIYTMYSSLKQMEEILDPEVFIRVHQGYIVNINEVAAFVNKQLLLCNCEKAIPVSRRNIVKLKRALE
ncbi:MAG: LytTR family transcriptional regulator DNA-binding domain-containing protein [Firmicutes bacterium]|jgi:DNA-binding LytR/AlgR family response regulator|nr:LytTR family transcriptional regulator DNA-binding domain-containing protein [Bacillota bacterium]